MKTRLWKKALVTWTGIALFGCVAAGGCYIELDEDDGICSRGNELETLCAGDNCINMCVPDERDCDHDDGRMMLYCLAESGDELPILCHESAECALEGPHVCQSMCVEHDYCDDDYELAVHCGPGVPGETGAYGEFNGADCNLYCRPRSDAS